MKKYAGFTMLAGMIAGFLSVGNIVYSQSDLKSEFSLYGGGEYNIFKSPDVLYSNTLGEFWDKDSLTISDAMIDVGYDLEFTSVRGERNAFAIGSDLWYRHYLQNEALNQARLNLYGDFTRMLSEKVHLGLRYNFRWSDRVGTSVTGDLLMRSFRYFGNDAMVCLDLLPSEKVSMNLNTRYQLKSYYDENTLDPINHANLEINYNLDLEPSRIHNFSLDLSFLNRQYFSYHALDGAGHYDRIYPFRQFRYYTLNFDYDLKPFRGFRINPGFKVRRRIDTFEDYYSYMSYAGGMRIRYMVSGFYVSVNTEYKRLMYDIREAFTSQAIDPSLVYGYLDLELTLKYDLSDRWEIFMKLESDGRSSNSDLDFLKTRRGYQNREAVLGINYSLPDIKWR